MTKIRIITRRALECRVSDRSTNFISPIFGQGCLYSCSYCYMRDNKPFGLDIPNNLDEILQAVKDHSETLQWPKQPDQTHPKYWTMDLSCSEDLALHLKYHDFDTIFNFFLNEPKLMGSFATKFVNKKLLEYNPQGKLRIRFSLMPQEYSTILEPKTSLIIDRIKAINEFIEAGWDVHINLSPIIAKKGSSELYKELFDLLNEYVKDEYKPSVKSECIFLTYSEKSYNRNSIENPEANDLCWSPEHQELKNSSYGKNRLRYQWRLKQKLVKAFTDLHQTEIPWSEIRYIF